LVSGGARRLVAVCALLLAALSLRANDLTVDRRTVRLNETVNITVELDDDFASLDTITVPVQHLLIEGPPAVSSQYNWINGSVIRRKVFHFVARATEPGPALVGPLVLEVDPGHRETLAPVALQVLPDETSALNEPEALLRELTATGREPLFVVAEMDKAHAVAGEEIVVTWWLYNGANVQQWQVDRVPKLDDFWVEEIDVRNEQPRQVIVGLSVMQALPVRRVALFPLHDGHLTIGSLAVEAQVLKRESGSFGGIFEGAMVDVRFPSANLFVDVDPLPAGPPVDLVGDVELTCTAPRQTNGGPVTFDATLSGRANLRGAPAPRWSGSTAGPIAGDVEIVPGPVKVARTQSGVVMTRKWSYLIFPERSGTLTIPPLTANVFSPASGGRQTLRGGGGSLTVSAAVARPSAAPAAATDRRSGLDVGHLLTIAGIVAALIILALLLVPRLRRAAGARRQTKLLIEGKSAAEIREAVDEWLRARKIEPARLLEQPSDRGDAFRALRSILDAAQRDHLSAAESAREIRLRTRDLVESFR
jgi:hypothetical protein